MRTLVYESADVVQKMCNFVVDISPIQPIAYISKYDYEYDYEAKVHVDELILSSNTYLSIMITSTIFFVIHILHCAHILS